MYDFTFDIDISTSPDPQDERLVQVDAEFVMELLATAQAKGWRLWDEFNEAAVEELAKIREAA